MDAVVFLETRDRMCRSHLLGEKRGSMCKGCGLHDAMTWAMTTCHDLINMCPEKAVAIVEQWAREHPRKTRQSEFLKVFPRANLGDDGMIKFCPQELDSNFLCPQRQLGGRNCTNCRKDFWLAEVKSDA